MLPPDEVDLPSLYTDVSRSLSPTPKVELKEAQISDPYVCPVRFQIVGVKTIW